MITATFVRHLPTKQGPFGPVEQQLWQLDSSLVLPRRSPFDGRIRHQAYSYLVTSYALDYEGSEIAIFAAHDDGYTPPEISALSRYDVDATVDSDPHITILLKNGYLGIRPVTKIGFTGFRGKLDTTPTD